MNNIKNKNAVSAFIAEYRKVVIELKNVIEDVSPTELTTIADEVTTNPECRSIQTVLTHVVSSGYSYCVYIQNHRNIDSKRPEQKLLLSATEYSRDLDELLAFTDETFLNIFDHDLEEPDKTKKIVTKWGQSYDIEQMMEHAIVHVLRHRRQITNFKRSIRS